MFPQTDLKHMPYCTFVLQDMPGWGDDMDLIRYLRVVTTFLLEQRIKDYEKLGGEHMCTWNVK